MATAYLHASDRLADLAAADEWGGMCALAGTAQRDLARCAGTYRQMYSAGQFDAGLFSTLAFACAYGAPWLPAERLCLATRVCFWCFGLDWLIDYAATARGEVRAIRRRCLEVAAGQPPVPGDDLTGFLAALRADLSTAPHSAAVQGIWLDELRRMLDAMAREFEWRGRAPSFEEYLDNADNLGFCFAFVSHWFLVPSVDDLDALLAAARRAQLVIRLANDLGTYQRDLRWGDLNALRLKVTREQVLERISVLVDECAELIGPLRARQPELAGYLARQIGFNLGFYRIGDYWGG